MYGVRLYFEEKEPTTGELVECFADYYLITVNKILESGDISSNEETQIGEWGMLTDRELKKTNGYLHNTLGRVCQPSWLLPIVVRRKFGIDFPDHEGAFNESYDV